MLCPKSRQYAKKTARVPCPQDPWFPSGVNPTSRPLPSPRKPRTIDGFVVYGRLTTRLAPTQRGNAGGVRRRVGGVHVVFPTVFY